MKSVHEGYWKPQQNITTTTTTTTTTTSRTRHSMGFRVGSSQSGQRMHSQHHTQGMSHPPGCCMSPQHRSEEWTKKMHTNSQRGMGYN